MFHDYALYKFTIDIEIDIDIDIGIGSWLIDRSYLLTMNWMDSGLGPASVKPIDLT